MTTSTVLRALQKRGLLQQEEHLTDARAKVVELTSEGRRIAKLAVRTVEQFDGEFFYPLGNKTEDFNKKLNSLLTQKNEY